MKTLFNIQSIKDNKNYQIDKEETQPQTPNDKGKILLCNKKGQKQSKVQKYKIDNFNNNFDIEPEEEQNEQKDIISLLGSIQSNENANPNIKKFITKKEKKKRGPKTEKTNGNYIHSKFNKDNRIMKVGRVFTDTISNYLNYFYNPKGLSFHKKNFKDVYGKNNQEHKLFLKKKVQDLFFFNERNSEKLEEEKIDSDFLCKFLDLDISKAYELYLKKKFYVIGDNKYLVRLTIFFNNKMKNIKNEDYLELLNEDIENFIQNINNEI